MKPILPLLFRYIFRFAVLMIACIILATSEGSSSNAQDKYRSELETVCNNFIKSLQNRDINAILSILFLDMSDQDVVRDKNYLVNNLNLSCDYLLLIYPKLSNITYIKYQVIKDSTVAYYYFVWTPSPRPTLAQFEQKITPKRTTYVGPVVDYWKFVKSHDQWKLDFEGNLFEPGALEQPLMLEENDDIYQAAETAIKLWFWQEEDKFLVKLDFVNIFIISLFIIIVIFTLMSIKDYLEFRRTSSWPSTIGRIETLDNLGNFSYEYFVNGQAYKSNSLDLSDLAARCRNRKNDPNAEKACSGLNLWLNFFHSNSYYQFLPEEAVKVTKSIAERSNQYSLSQPDNERDHFIAIKRRAYDTSRHFSQGDKVTIYYESKNPAASILFPYSNPQSHKPTIFRTIMFIFVGMTSILIESLLEIFFKFPEWIGNVLISSIVILILVIYVKNRRNKVIKPEEEFSLYAPDMSQIVADGNDEVWLNTEGYIFVSYIDRTIKRKQTNYPISRIVYKYKVNGIQYSDVFNSHGREIANEFQENDRVQISYLESNPSISRLIRK